MANSTASASVSRTGLGLTGWLTIIFVVLKLNPGGYLDSPVQDWSWWLVFSPVLFWVALIVLFALGGLLVLGIAGILDAIDKRRWRKRQAKRIAERRNNLNRFK